MADPGPKGRDRSIVWMLATAVSSVALVLTAIFFLSALTGPFGPALVLIVGVLFAFVGFHYVVWGRWLGPMIRASVDAETNEAEEQPAAKRDPLDTDSAA